MGRSGISQGDQSKTHPVAPGSIFDARQNYDITQLAKRNTARNNRISGRVYIFITKKGRGDIGKYTLRFQFQRNVPMKTKDYAMSGNKTKSVFSITREIV
jgi:hypothetical protein